MVYFFAFFVLLSAVHLYTCYFGLNQLRMATKPLLLPSLALFYALAAHHFSWFILIALMLGMAGDVFLLWPRVESRFMAGAILFSLGHLLYAFTLFSHLSRMGASYHAWVVMLVALPYVVAVVLICLYIIPNIDKVMLKLGMPFYFGLIALVNIGAWLTLINAAGSAAQEVLNASLLVVGGILFFASDTILIKGMFIVEKERTNFYVMLTYIAAQFCLCLGFVGLL